MHTSINIHKTLFYTGYFVTEKLRDFKFDVYSTEENRDSQIFGTIIHGRDRPLKNPKITAVKLHAFLILFRFQNTEKM